uniref:Uncharacterized protein n=1 Tax=Avena sativa TaxID=4498 RepID=A0ACD6ADV6_AVESA
MRWPPPTRDSSSSPDNLAPSPAILRAPPPLLTPNHPHQEAQAKVWTASAPFPDDLLLLILARLGCAATAARAGVLARRWHDLWTRLPVLGFPGVSFDSLEPALGRVSFVVSLLEIHVPDDKEDLDSKEEPRSYSPGVNSLMRAAERLAPPVGLTGVEFPELQALSLSGCVVDVNTLLSRCPNIHVLNFKDTTNCLLSIEDNYHLKVHSASLQELVADTKKAWTSHVDIVAPLLKQLTISFRSLKELNISILAPMVEKADLRSSYQDQIKGERRMPSRTAPHRELNQTHHRRRRDAIRRSDPISNPQIGRFHPRHALPACRPPPHHYQHQQPQHQHQHQHQQPQHNHHQQPHQPQHNHHQQQHQPQHNHHQQQQPTWKEAVDDRRRYAPAHQEAEDDRRRYAPAHQEAEADRYAPAHQEAEADRRRYAPAHQEAEADRRRYSSAHQEAEDSRRRYSSAHQEAEDDRRRYAPPHELHLSPSVPRKRQRCALHDGGDLESTSSSGQLRQQPHPNYAPVDSYVDRTSAHPGYSHESLSAHSDSKGSRKVDMPLRTTLSGSPRATVTAQPRHTPQKPTAPRRLSVWQRIEESPASAGQLPKAVHISPSKSNNGGSASKELSSVISADCKAKSAGSNDGDSTKVIKRALSSVLVKPSPESKEKERDVEKLPAEHDNTPKNVSGSPSKSLGLTGRPVAGVKKVKKIVIKKIVRKIGGKDTQISSTIVSEKRDTVDANANASEREEGEIITSSLEKDIVSEHNLVSTSDTAGAGNVQKGENNNSINSRKRKATSAIESKKILDPASLNGSKHPGKGNNRSSRDPGDTNAASAIKSREALATRRSEHSGKKDRNSMDSGVTNDNHQKEEGEILSLSGEMNAAVASDPVKNSGRSEDSSMEESKFPKDTSENNTVSINGATVNHDATEICGSRGARREDNDIFIDANEEDVRPMVDIPVGNPNEPAIQAIESTDVMDTELVSPQASAEPDAGLVSPQVSVEPDAELVSPQVSVEPDAELVSPQVSVEPDHTYDSNAEGPVDDSSTKQALLSSWIESIVSEAKKENQPCKSTLPSIVLPDKLLAPKEDSRRAVSDLDGNPVVRPPLMNRTSSMPPMVAPKQVNLPSSSREPPCLSSNPRHKTWHRGNMAPSTSFHGSQPSGLPPKQPPRRNDKTSNSYIRKGNALIRNPATGNPPRSSSSLDTQKPVTRRSMNFVRKVDSNGSVARTNFTVERPKTPPLPLHAKSINSTTSLSEQLSKTLPKQHVPETEKQDPIGQLNSGVEIPHIQSAQISEPSDASKVVYVRPKSNQLVAAQRQHPDDPINSSMDKVLALQPPTSSDLYFKKRKNQIVLSSSSSDGLITKEAAPAESLNSGENKGVQVASSNNSINGLKGRPHKAFQRTNNMGTFSHVWTLSGQQPQRKGHVGASYVKAFPRILPWKRKVYYKNFGSSHTQNVSSLRIVR